MINKQKKGVALERAALSVSDEKMSIKGIENIEKQNDMRFLR